MAVVRHTYGFTNRGVGEGLGSFLPIFDPTQYVVDWEDFLLWDNTDNVDWAITINGTGTITAGDAQGGTAVLATSGTEDHNVFAQRVAAAFRWEPTRKMWFESRFKISDATQSDIAIGLQVTDTSPLDTADGIFFLSIDGSAALDFRVEKNDTATTSAAVATLANDTYIKVGFYYDGGNSFDVYVNNTKVTTLSNPANAPDDVDISITMGVQAGAAAVTTLTVDYMLAIAERGTSTIDT